MDGDTAAESAQHPESTWAIVANVREDIPIGESAQEARRGTFHFRAKAKVYIAGINWDQPAANVKVIIIGHFRGRQHVTAVVNARYLTNWRVELAYSPTVIDRMRTPHPAAQSVKWLLDGSPEAKSRAEELAIWLKEYSDEYHAKRLDKRAASQADQQEPEI